MPSLSASLRVPAAEADSAFFLLSLVLSPLIGILFVMAMPNLKHEDLLKQIAGRTPPPLPQKRIGGKADRVTIDRTPRPFEPDGVFAGVPYRVAARIGVPKAGSPQVRAVRVQNFTRS